MGNAFVHVELNTDDLGKARKFYGALFDWKLSDMSMGPGAVYTMIDVGTGMGGGMQVKPMAAGPNALGFSCGLGGLCDAKVCERCRRRRNRSRPAAANPRWAARPPRGVGMRRWGGRQAIRTMTSARGRFSN